MKHRRIQLTDLLVIAFSFSMLLLAGNLVAQQAEPGNNRSIDSNKARVVEYWTSDRRAAAVPRDLVIDSRGLGYMRLPDGTLQPYGHQISATAPNSPAPMVGRPPSNDDTTPPVISGMNPEDEATIGAVQTFSANVTDDSGVTSVTFNLQANLSSPIESFAGSPSGGDNWSVALQDFADGEQWEWWVTAKDNVRRGGNTATSVKFNLIVDTGSGNGTGGGDTVTNGTWTTPGAVKNAAGRIFFEMPRNSKLKGPWNGFVCSGTVATDDTDGLSVIITAAHCVYDDVNKAFARNVLFIPNQQETTGSGTDSDCSNDPIGCWMPTFGAVDVHWTTRTFPDNIKWDYAYYVVDDMDAHSQGQATTDTDVLDVEAGSLTVNFSTFSVDDESGLEGAESPDFTHALGYSLSYDPLFKYCAENMTIVGTDNWLLPSCGLSGGASGGPWVQPMNTDTGSPDIGSGPIISVNSWGSSGSPGIAGPKLVGTSASCVFDMAKSDSSVISSNAQDGQAGIKVEGCP